MSLLLSGINRHKKELPLEVRLKNAVKTFLDGRPNEDIETIMGYPDLKAKSIRLSEIKRLPNRPLEWSYLVHGIYHDVSGSVLDLEQLNETDKFKVLIKMQDILSNYENSQNARPDPESTSKICLLELGYDKQWVEEFAGRFLCPSAIVIGERAKVNKLNYILENTYLIFWQAMSDKIINIVRNSEPLLKNEFLSLTPMPISELVYILNNFDGKFREDIIDIFKGPTRGVGVKEYVDEVTMIVNKNRKNI